MLLFVPLILLSQGLVVLGANPILDSALLCDWRNDDSDTPQINTLSYLIQVRDTIHKQPHCRPMVKNALNDLVDLVESSKTDLCSFESIGKLRAFYKQYLDLSVESWKETVPWTLRRFLIGYGMQMSNMCKKNMVKVLVTGEARSMLTEADFEQLDRFTNEHGPVAEVLGAMGGPDEILLPGDLAPILKQRNNIDPNGVTGQRMYVQTSSGSIIKYIKTVCQQRFKPIYGPLMLPLIKLSNLGFNYKDEPLKCNLKCDNVVREVGLWSRIVFLCESINEIEIVDAAPADSKVVRIITEEEAEAMGFVPEFTAIISSIECKPSVPVVLEGDLIVDPSNTQLVKEVKGLNTRKSEEDHIKRRMWDKGMSLLRNQLSKGNVGFVISNTFKALVRRVRDEEISGPSEQMVKSLEEMIQRYGQSAVGQAATHAIDAAGIMVAQVSFSVVLIALSMICTLGAFGFMASSMLVTLSENK